MHTIYYLKLCLVKHLVKQKVKVHYIKDHNVIAKQVVNYNTEIAIDDIATDTFVV